MATVDTHPYHVVEPSPWPILGALSAGGSSSRGHHVYARCYPLGFPCGNDLGSLHHVCLVERRYK